MHAQQAKQSRWMSTLAAALVGVVVSAWPLSGMGQEAPRQAKVALAESTSQKPSTERLAADERRASLARAERQDRLDEQEGRGVADARRSPARAKLSHVTIYNVGL